LSNYQIDDGVIGEDDVPLDVEKREAGVAD
jgi:hypothetical protein